MWDNDDSNNHKRVSTRKDERKRFQFNGEANQDLKPFITFLARKHGLTRKLLISKILLDCALEYSNTEKRYGVLMERLEESKKLIKLDIKPKETLTKQEFENSKDFFIEYLRLTAQYAPNEFLYLTKIIQERIKFMKDNYVNRAQNEMDRLFD